MANKSTIERTAVNYVKTVLNDTGYINTSYVQEGDKEPLYDGDIYIYDTQYEERNEHLLAKVAIQIKGVTENIEKKMQFHLDMCSLKQYKKNDGVFFFVVQVNLMTKIHKIFYADLLPFNIDKLLTKFKNKKHAQFPVKEFPLNCNELVETISIFAKNKELQKGYTLVKQPIVKNFKQLFLPVSYIGSNIDWDKVLLNYEGFCYGELDNGIPIPVKEIKKGDIYKTEHYGPANVSVGNKTYFTSYQRKINSNSCSLILNNMEFIWSGNQAGYCNINYGGTLMDCINALSFIIEVSQEKNFSIDGVKHGILIDDCDTKKLKNNLCFLEKFNEALSLSGFSGQFYINGLSDEDVRNINILIWCFSENKEIELDTDIALCPFKLTICNQDLVFFAKKQINHLYKLTSVLQKGNYKIGNTPVSGSILLGRDYLKNAINLNFFEILTDIKSFGEDNEYLSIVNRFLLELIAAYDESKKNELLEVANNLVQWLEEKNTLEVNSIIYHLNYLQCMYRKMRCLSNDDESFLLDIIEKERTPLLKYGAYVLLKNKKAAQRQFNLLSNQEQEGIQSFPIYNLWKELNNG